MATSAAAGRYFLNGKDLFLIFGIGVESGSDDFLKFPAKKESITHDWMDSNGVDTDLTRWYGREKEITLKCWLMAKSEVLFWKQYGQFLAEITQPGVQRLEISELNKSFFIYYKECTSFDRPTRIKNTTFIGCFFTLTVVEQEPKLDASNIYIVDESGRFLVS